MRYESGVVVFIPWLDSNNDRNHTRFTFRGEVDRRRVRRTIRRALKKIGISAPKWWLNHYMRHKSYELGHSSPT